MVTRRLGGLLLALTAGAGCSAPASPTITTGLTGVVIRGPIMPVCQIQIPCDAPFSAQFVLEQNGRDVGQFRSGADGRFTVMLPSGVYRIIPAADAPIMLPQSQTRTAEVLPVGLTQVLLDFDTGIR